ncbi:ribonuclease H-like protein [Penicillium pulvis]|uniref:ribonuclease H-like protein n=1 Tax=Penicillium pulvis TaxID=1562058 RepID=UPI002549693B|nr:ribonuclease H-like protein [Penicillium pulvis]KAJ5813378.1 ribonuclease H-like protein [Penicillium pulvis]
MEDPRHVSYIGHGEVRASPTLPTVFNPQTHLPNGVALHPQTLFPLDVSQNAVRPVLRFINLTNSTEFLIYTDGSCLQNGQQNPKAGCAFVYKNTGQQPNGYVRFRLEEEGPTGVRYRPTSNRAELRAVIAALRFREWSREGFSSLVIATDSTHVAEGMTSWVREWLERDWTKSDGKLVTNRDLWECLLDEVNHCQRNGLHVKFWRIPRKWNEAADRHAKHAATHLRAQEKFTHLVDDAR